MPANSFSTLIKITTTTAAVLLLTGAASAGTISVAWDPVSHPDLLGYRVYQGTSSGNYPQSIDVGLETQTELSGLADCTTHYVAVRARASGDVLSDEFSNQIAGWPVPRVDGIDSPVAEAGTQLQLTISGANYQAGAVVSFVDPAISVDSVAVTSCNSVVATISIGTAAILGATGFEVLNPDQSYVVTNGLLQITEAVDEEGPLISSLEAGVVGSTRATITWATDEPADGQVSYRRVGESTYQLSEQVSELMTNHAIALNGLRPGTEYEFFVDSRDESGNLTTSPVIDFITLTNDYSYIRFEAESGQPEAPFELSADPDAFGGASLTLAAGTASGSANSPAGTRELGFQLTESGTYSFWYRLYGANAAHDSWFEGVDGSDLASISPTSAGVWQWVEGRTVTLDAGLHSVMLGGQEASARIDRILITDDLGFEPTEQPGSDITPPDAVTDFQGEAGDTVNDLSWVIPGGGDLASVVVRYRTDGVVPTSPVDGHAVFDGPAQAGASGSVQHTGLANGASYAYSVFVLDIAENVSAGRSMSLTPSAPFVPLGVVGNLRRTDLKQ